MNLHCTRLQISLKMALEIGPKHVAGIIMQYDLIKYKFMSDCIIIIIIIIYFILYFKITAVY